jgi:hypothetical protein
LRRFRLCRAAEQARTRLPCAAVKLPAAARPPPAHVAFHAPDGAQAGVAAPAAAAPTSRSVAFDAERAVPTVPHAQRCATPPHAVPSGGGAPGYATAAASGRRDVRALGSSPPTPRAQHSSSKAVKAWPQSDNEGAGRLRGEPGASAGAEKRVQRGGGATPPPSGSRRRLRRAPVRPAGGRGGSGPIAASPAATEAEASALKASGARGRVLPMTWQHRGRRLALCSALRGWLLGC